MTVNDVVLPDLSQQIVLESIRTAQRNLEDKENVLFCEKKVLSLITEFLKSIDLALIIDPWSDKESKVNKN